MIEGVSWPMPWRENVSTAVSIGWLANLTRLAIFSAEPFLFTDLAYRRAIGEHFRFVTKF